MDGRNVRIDDIGGVRYGDYAPGDVVAVAFPPGQPQDAVTGAVHGSALNPGRDHPPHVWGE